MVRTRTALLTLTGLGLVAIGWRVISAREDEPQPMAGAPASVVRHAPAAVPVAVGVRERHGDESERGSGGAVRLDLSRAQESGLQPVVEFLTFLQQTRGENSHLLFVRYDDLDDLAEAEGASSAEFLTRLDQLGVVVSNN